jgi:tRNA(Ile)-lysidine synthase
MSPVLDVLRHALGGQFGSYTHWCVALSGGLDSTVLLHALCVLRAEYPDSTIRAVHVNHGLHPKAHDWVEHCERLCRELEVPLRAQNVQIEAGRGMGLEAAARDARYGVFERLIGRDECLLTAHHQDDQVETFLLRVLRGAGLHGLAGIPEQSRFGAGWLIRPLLDLSRQALIDYAESAELKWLDDPSNTDTGFDRNYLRHEIVPLLRKRWPGVGKTIGRAARLSAEAVSLLDSLAENDSRRLEHDGTLSLTGLKALAPSRQRNVIRHILNRRGLEVPNEIQLRAGLQQLMSAKPDRQPIVGWGQVQIRRYRDRLFFLDFNPSAVGEVFPCRYEWDGHAAIDMGPVRGRLSLIPDRAGTITIPEGTDALVVKFRHGGERIKTVNQRHHQSLKKLFQQHGILPWMRRHVPLLYVQDRLFAVGDLWISTEAAGGQGKPGYRIVWENHPRIQ